MKRPAVILSRITTWFQENRLDWSLLFLILALGALLRLYRISEYMTFLGDEGRDALAVRNMIVQGRPVLIGPGTSTGDMVLGPLYYYLMAPALLLSNYSPVGPAVLVAVLGVATIGLVWWVGRQWFPAIPGRPNWGALAAAGLYATSPAVILYSRSSWNPNIMPFFALLTVYAAWRACQQFDFKWWIIAGAAFACVIQSHYLGLLLLPILGLVWSFTWVKIVRGRRKLAIKLATHSILGLCAFLLLMSPLIYYDARHGWRNFAAMRAFFAGSQGNLSPDSGSILSRLAGNFIAFSSLLIYGGDGSPGRLISILLVIGIIVFTILTFKQVWWRKENLAISLPLAWLFLGLVGLSFYRQPVFDHYYEFLFPAPFLLAGGVIQGLDYASAGQNRSFKVIYYLSLLGALGLFLANLSNTPVKFPPLRQLQRSQAVAEKIVSESDGQAFNLAVAAERNYEAAYRYFLEASNAPVIEMDPRRLKETVMEQMFIVCELPEEQCDPAHTPKTPFSRLGKVQVDGQWEVSGITLYKLIHSR